MPKRLLWFIAIAVAGLFYVLWDTGRVPARVTVMNQGSTAAQNIRLITDSGSTEIGTLRGGESRALSVAPSERVELSYRWGEDDRRWRSTEPLGPGQPLVLYIEVSGRVTPRRGLRRG